MRASGDRARSWRSAATLPVTNRRAAQRSRRPHRLEPTGYHLAPGEVDHHGQLDRVEHGGQGRDAHVALAEPDDVGQVQVAHGGMEPPQPVEGLVVQHHDGAVAGAAQVDLHHVRSRGRCGREGGERVLPVADRLAAVGDGEHPRQAACRRRPRPPRWR